jgi:predicted outer membrane repeat protein
MKYLIACILLIEVVNISSLLINSSSQLEDHLCNANGSPQHEVLSLESSVKFTLPQGNFCQVVNGGNILINSSSLIEPAIITCKPSRNEDNIYHQQTRGLVFFNSTVTLERLRFEDCGTFIGTLPSELISYFNVTSAMHYDTLSHAAALITIYSNVTIRQVDIINSYGFGFIGLNLPGLVMEEVNVNNSTASSVDDSVIGSGVLLHYRNVDTDMRVVYNTTVYIHNSNFIGNSVKRNESLEGHKKSCITDDYYHKAVNREMNRSLLNAAGLTMIYTQDDFNVDTVLSRVTFKNNEGNLKTPGGLLVFHCNTSVSTRVAILNSTFDSNTNSPNSYCHGASVSYYWFRNLTDHKCECGEEPVPVVTPSEPLTFNDTRFINNDAGPIFMGIIGSGSDRLKIGFNDCSFIRNTVPGTSGACLFAAVFKYMHYPPPYINIVLNNIDASENGQKLFDNDKSFLDGTIFTFYRIQQINITGLSNFSNNSGSVIDVLDCDVTISNTTIFSHNIGSSGAAIKLRNSQLTFLNASNIKFAKNYATESGGAIYTTSGIDGFLKKICPIQVLNEYGTITFSENNARNKGQSIYGQSLFHCYLHNGAMIPEDYYNKNFMIDSYAIATTPERLTWCNPREDIKAYPGQEMYFCIGAGTYVYHSAATTSNESYTYSVVKVDVILRDEPNTRGKVWLSKAEYNQIVYENKIHCTKTKITIYCARAICTEKEPKHVQVIYSIPWYYETLVINVTLKPCPLGFMLSDEGGCVCEPVFKNNMTGLDVNCDISTQTITGFLTGWAGNIKNGSDVFGASYTCPSYYCRQYVETFHSNSTGFLYKSNKHSKQLPMCYYGRIGAMCGNCPYGKTAVFGSYECLTCSDWWLLTILLYALAGPLIICLLYAFNITLTVGTFNGIIFFAQLANCGIYDILNMSLIDVDQEPYFVRFCIIVLSFLNLGIGFPVCFYHKMNEIIKIGLTLVFPLYLLAIVVFLIIVSRYSTRLSNKISHLSVQVLVTVVHLSFSKLLVTLIDVFTPATLYIESQDHLRWYVDGTVRFLDGSHLFLSILTILVVVPLILPYISILIFERPLRYTPFYQRIRPILEAIHAPYKDKKECWFVARLILFLFMSLIYAIFRGTNASMIYEINTPVFIFFVLIQSYVKPFKTSLLNILDLWFSAATILLLTTTWLYFVKRKTNNIAFISSAIVTFYILSVIFVFIYHILSVFNKLEPIKRIINKTRRRSTSWITSSITAFANRERKHYQHQILLHSSNDSYYGSCNYRETLLDSQSTK